MFLELKDGRVVNLDRVALVEPFNAAASAAQDRFKAADTRYIQENEQYNARIYVCGAQDGSIPRCDTIKNWQLIEETPAEFQVAANALLADLKLG